MSDAVFLNDVPYNNAEEDPKESLITTLAFSVDDWGSSRAMSWVWGIVCGWDDDGAMDEQAARHGWSDETVAQLRRLHERFAEQVGDAHSDKYRSWQRANEAPTVYSEDL